ncbi:MAG: hypothetical protein PHT02_14525 [Tissierellia bacterium]|nr:hypothetical protein [Tissierellia bacterium]
MKKTNGFSTFFKYIYDIINITTGNYITAGTDVKTIQEDEIDKLSRNERIRQICH